MNSYVMFFSFTQQGIQNIKNSLDELRRKKKDCQISGRGSEGILWHTRKQARYHIFTGSTR